MSRKRLESYWKIKTTKRQDICQALYDEVLKELSMDGYTEIALNEEELTHINTMIMKI